MAMSAQAILCGEDVVQASMPVMRQEIEDPTSYVLINEHCLSIIAANIESSYYNGIACCEVPTTPLLEEERRNKLETEDIVKLGGEDEVMEKVKLGGDDEVLASQFMKIGGYKFGNKKDALITVIEMNLAYLGKELSHLQSENKKLNQKCRDIRECFDELEQFYKRLVFDL